MVNRKEIDHSNRLVDLLDLTPGFTTEDLIAAVERHRNRKITCIGTSELDTEAEVCGLVVSLLDENTDVIFYAASLSPWHRAHTIAHELGHLIAGHTRSAAQLPDLLMQRIRRLLEARYHAPLVGRMLGRHRFDTAEEQEAELFASVVLGRQQATEEAAAPDAIADVFQPNRSNARRPSTP